VDGNDDGRVDLSDAVWMLDYTFLNGAPPPDPFLDCGQDPTGDPLGCEAFADCLAE
jgi:hypothetical protein